MGLLLALLIPANAGPGMINLIYLPMSFASGFWMPLEYLPHWLQSHCPGPAHLSSGTTGPDIFGYAQPGSMLKHWEALVGFTC